MRISFLMSHFYKSQAFGFQIIYRKGSLELKEKVDFLHTGIKYVCTVGKVVKKIQTKTVTRSVVENKKHHTCVIEEV